MVCTFKNAFDGRELELKLRGDTWGKNAEICLNDMPIAFINHQIMNAREWFTGQDSVSTRSNGKSMARIANNRRSISIHPQVVFPLLTRPVPCHHRSRRRHCAHRRVLRHLR